MRSDCEGHKRVVGLDSWLSRVSTVPKTIWCSDWQGWRGIGGDCLETSRRSVMLAKSNSNSRPSRRLTDMTVEILSHPQTVVTASHHFAKPTASPSSRWRWCTAERERLEIIDISSLYTGDIENLLHISSWSRSDLSSLLLGDWHSQQIELWRAA
jgi:hypothetical protein